MPFLSDEQTIQPSNLENIDQAFFDFINTEMTIQCFTNEGLKKVPVIWGTSERAALSKLHDNIRDQDGTLIFPLISIERGNISKDSNNKGTFYGTSGLFLDPKKGGRIIVSRRLVQEKTSNFANNDSRKRHNGTVGNGQEWYPRKNDKIVYETISIPVPVYIMIQYVVYIKSEFRMQHNQIVQPFYNLGGAIKSFNIRSNGHKYECFLKDPQDTTNTYSLSEDQQREFETKINFDVLGYIMGDDINQDTPSVIRRQNFVELKTPREHVVFGDVNDWNNKPYREQ